LRGAKQLYTAQGRDTPPDLLSAGAGGEDAFDAEKAPEDQGALNPLWAADDNLAAQSQPGGTWTVFSVNKMIRLLVVKQGARFVGESLPSVNVPLLWKDFPCELGAHHGCVTGDEVTALLERKIRDLGYDVKRERLSFESDDGDILKVSLGKCTSEDASDDAEKHPFFQAVKAVNKANTDLDFGPRLEAAWRRFYQEKTGLEFDPSLPEWSKWSRDRESQLGLKDLSIPCSVWERVRDFGRPVAP
jgi:hypothetical protein